MAKDKFKFKKYSDDETYDSERKRKKSRRDHRRVRPPKGSNQWHEQNFEEDEQ